MLLQSVFQNNSSTLKRFFLLLMLSLVIGLKTGQASSLCVPDVSCQEQLVCSPPGTGLIETGQGRVSVVCGCDVIVTVKNNRGEVVRLNVPLGPGETLAENLTFGTYIVEARRQGSSIVEQVEELHKR